MVGLRQLCPAAYPHRVAALAALALVGQGGGAAPVLLVLLSAVDPQPLLPEHPEVENPLAVPVPTGLLLAVAAIAALIVLASLVAAAWSLVVRFRRARGVERQQLRWLALGAAVSGAVALLVGVVAGAMAKDSLVLAALGTCVALLPLATGASILRYRLYDLDRIISRTLAYGLLTVLLGGGYAGVVLGLGQLLGRDSSLVVAAATLAVAAAFQPARRRIQQAVDRRFNRRRYDAARMIQAFSGRLRQQVDLEALTGELLAVVEQTMQPTRISLTDPPHTTPWAHPAVRHRQPLGPTELVPRTSGHCQPGRSGVKTPQRRTTRTLPPLFLSANLTRPSDRLPVISRPSVSRRIGPRRGP